MRRVSDAPTSPVAGCRARLPFPRLDFRQIIETARTICAVPLLPAVEWSQWSKRLSLPQLLVVARAISLRQDLLAAVREGARTGQLRREHVFDHSIPAVEMRAIPRGLRAAMPQGSRPAAHDVGSDGLGCWEDPWSLHGVTAVGNWAYATLGGARCACGRCAHHRCGHRGSLAVRGARSPGGWVAIGTCGGFRAGQPRPPLELPTGCAGPRVRRPPQLPARPSRCPAPYPAAGRLLPDRRHGIQGRLPARGDARRRRGLPD